MDLKQNHIEETNKKKQKEADEDRISKLPDSLIIDQIISRLPEIRFAIRTGTLSKRWQDLWHSVNSLIFDVFSLKTQTSKFDENPLPVFYISVNKTLTQLDVIDIKKFEITANYTNEFEAYVENFIDFAIDRNVKEFKIHLWFKEAENQFIFKNDSFFNNCHFRKLDLAYCEISPKAAINWENLIHLSIGQALANEELIENIQSGSPMLETLRLAYCYGSLINITSKSVKELVLDGYDGQEDEYVAEINAPYISSLTIMGDLNLSNLLLQDVSSLVSAKLDYVLLGYMSTNNNDYEQDMLKTLILHLRHVKELEVGGCCYKQIMRLLATGFVPTSNMKIEDFSWCHNILKD